MAHKLTAQKPSPIVYQGEAVVTTAQLAEYYGVAAKNLQDNHANNRARFVEGKHCQTLTNGKLKAFKDCPENIGSVQIAKNTRNLTLWTRRGAARHAKMLNSDKAWEVFEALEDSYFNAPAPDELPFTMAELTTQARELLALSEDAAARTSILHHKVSSLFSKAQHNAFYAPRAPKKLPAPKGKTNVRAHLRKLPNRNQRKDIQ